MTSSPLPCYKELPREAAREGFLGLTGLWVRELDQRSLLRHPLASSLGESRAGEYSGSFLGQGGAHPHLLPCIVKSSEGSSRQGDVIDH